MHHTQKGWIPMDASGTSSTYNKLLFRCFVFFQNPLHRVLHKNGHLLLNIGRVHHRVDLTPRATNPTLQIRLVCGSCQVMAECKGFSKTTWESHIITNLRPTMGIQSLHDKRPTSQHQSRRRKSFQPGDSGPGGWSPQAARSWPSAPKCWFWKPPWGSGARRPSANLWQTFPLPSTKCSCPPRSSSQKGCCLAHSEHLLRKLHMEPGCTCRRARQRKWPPQAMYDSPASTAHQEWKPGRWYRWGFPSMPRSSECLPDRHIGRIPQWIDKWAPQARWRAIASASRPRLWMSSSPSSVQAG